MLEAKERIEPTKKIVIRLLNGQLRGCEFTLITGRTFFFVTDDGTIQHQHQGTLLPENIIYIPAENQGVNFEIIVANDDELPVSLHEMREEGEKERALKPNEIIAVGDLKFAWRNDVDIFTDDILFAQLESVSVGEEFQVAVVKTRFTSRWWTWGAVLGVVGCLSLASYIYLTATQRQITTISALLNYDSGNYQIVYGQDKMLYIVAVNNKSAEWATQTMVRTPPPYRTKVVTKEAEEKRVSQWIASHWPRVKFHRIKLDDPQHPVIELSAERSKLSETEKAEFLASVAQTLPYASNVILASLQDKTVRTLAEQGLQKMALVFTETNHGDSTTFIIRGAIEDGELERIKAFVNQYYQVWGGNYVQFALELKNDWLKGKSFKYGEQGYVKLAPGHWYFPSHLKKEP